MKGLARDQQEGNREGNVSELLQKQEGTIKSLLREQLMIIEDDKTLRKPCIYSLRYGIKAIQSQKSDMRSKKSSFNIAIIDIHTRSCRLASSTLNLRYFLRTQLQRVVRISVSLNSCKQNDYTCFVFKKNLYQKKVARCTRLKATGRGRTTNAASI